METLVKGQNVQLTGVQQCSLGLSWDANTSGQTADLDAFAICLKSKEGPGLDQKHVIYYGNKRDPEGAIIHSGDNLTGAGDGDDETINVDFTKMNSEVEAVIFGINIYDAKNKKQNFGMVKNPKARLYFGNNTTADLVYELDEDFSTAISVKVCMLYKHNGEWKFKALGEGSDQTIAQMATEYGI